MQKARHPEMGEPAAEGAEASDGGDSSSALGLNDMGVDLEDETAEGRALGHPPARTLIERIRRERDLQAHDGP